MRLSGLLGLCLAALSLGGCSVSNTTSRSEGGCRAVLACPGGGEVSCEVRGMGARCMQDPPRGQVYCQSASETAQSVCGAGGAAQRPQTQAAPRAYSPWAGLRR